MITDNVTSTYTYLLNKYGPVLTLQEVAEVLKVKPATVTNKLSCFLKSAGNRGIAAKALADYIDNAYTSFL